MKVGFLLFTVLILFIFPVIGEEIVALSFEEDLGKNLEIFTEDGDAVSITSFSSKKGESREVPIYLSNANNLSKVEIIVRYNSNIIFPSNFSIGDLNLSYALGNEVELTIEPNESINGDFLLGKINFLAIGNGGTSTTLLIYVEELIDNTSQEIPHIEFSGVYGIELEEDLETPEDQNPKLGGGLGGLLGAEDKEAYAEENGLIYEDEEVKVAIETMNGIEEKFISLDEVTDLMNNQSVKKIIALQNNTLYFGLAVAVIISVVLMFAYYRKTSKIKKYKRKK